MNLCEYKLCGGSKLKREKLLNDDDGSDPIDRVINKVLKPFREIIENFIREQKLQEVQNFLELASDSITLFRENSKFCEIIIDQKICDFLGFLISDFENLLDPCLIRFLSVILSIPGTTISDEVLKNSVIVDYIFRSVFEKPISASSIIALNNFLPSCVNTDLVEVITTSLPFKRIFTGFNDEEEYDVDILYPLLFLAKSYCEILKIKLEEEDFFDMVHFIENIYSYSDNIIIREIDPHSVLFPLINTLIQNFNDLVDHLPQCFYDNLMLHSVSFKMQARNVQSITIVTNIVKILKKRTPSSAAITTSMFDAFYELYEEHGFSIILKYLREIPSKQKICVYEFIKAFGTVYPKIYSDDEILPIIELSQLEFVTCSFDLKIVIAKFMKKIIPTRFESYTLISEDFIVCLIESMTSSPELAKQAIKVLISFINACSMTDKIDEVKGLMMENDLQDQLTSVIDEIDDEQINELAKILENCFKDSDEDSC